MGSAVSRRRRPTGSSSHSSISDEESKSQSITDYPVVPDIQRSASAPSASTSENGVVSNNLNRRTMNRIDASTNNDDAAAVSRSIVNRSAVDATASATAEPVLSSSSGRAVITPTTTVVTPIHSTRSSTSSPPGEKDATGFDETRSYQGPSDPGRNYNSRSPPPHQDDDRKDYVEGELVQIVGGKSTHKGKVGIFAKRTPKRVAVKFDGIEKMVYFHPDNIQSHRNDGGGCYAGGGAYQQGKNGYTNPEAADAAITPDQSIGTQQENRPPDRTPNNTEGPIFDGVGRPQPEFCESNIMRFVGSMSPGRSFEGSDAANRPYQPERCESLSIIGRGRAAPTATSDCVARASESAEHHHHHWCIPGGDDPMLHSCLGLPENYRQLIAPGGNAELHATTAFHIFRDRLVMRKVSVTKEIKDFPRRYREHDGRTYEFLASKVHRHRTCIGNGIQFTKMEITVVYVLIEGHGVSPINLQEELEKIAAFGRLEPRKVAARLELFLSTAQKSNRKVRDYLIFDHMTSDDFDIIQENGNEGCGFIPRSYIQHFLGNYAKGKRTFAIQVRIFSTRLGIFKGMLMEKPGIDKIQLPDSMKKVGRSEESDTDDRTCLIINGNGVFPCSSHLQLSKTLHGKLLPKSHCTRKPSKMILSLLESLGVPRTVLDRYAEESRGSRGRFLKDCCLVGLADPSNFLPNGHVFITGISGTSDAFGNHVFVSRFPCTESTDGFVLPVVRSKPSSMPDSMWSWMNGLHFGGIIFGNPLPNQVPLPSLIASGDLDGDLYFVTWSKDILSYIRPIQPIAYDLEESSEPDTKDSAPWNENWLSEGQEVMGSVEALVDHTKLISRLHKIWKKFTKDLGNEHPDVLALGRAYKAAIDIGKHGGQVGLPQHLWCELPLQLQQYLFCD